MKKTLLLSSALMASAMISVNAADVVREQVLEHASKFSVASVKPMTVKADSYSKVFVPSFEFGKKGALPFTSVIGANDVVYRRPLGFFYFGLSPEGYAWDKYIFGSANAEATWLNNSGSAVKGDVEWEYLSGSGEGSEFAQTTNLKAPAYAGGYLYSAPVMTVGSKSYQSDYQVYAGGLTSFEINTKEQGEITAHFGVANYDINKGKMTYGPSFSNLADAESGILEYLQFIYTQSIGEENAKKIKDYRVENVATLYQQPESPYALNGVGVYAFISSDAKPTAEFVCRIFRALPGDDGKLGIEENPVTTSTIKLADAKVVNSGDDGKIYYLDFPIIKKDPIMGDYEYPMDVNTALYVEIGGLDKDDVGSFYPMWSTEDVVTLAQFQGKEEGYYETDSYIGGSFEFNGKRFEQNLPTIWSAYYTDKTATKLNPCTHFFFNLDVTYAYFNCEEDMFDAPVAGGTHTFKINTCTTSDSWTVDETEDGTLPDWLSWNAGEWNKETEDADLTVTVKALPSDVKGRQAKLTLRIPGATKVFTVSQGEAGVSVVEDSANKVVVAGGNFQVTAANAGLVEVFNAAGQKVAEAQVDGTATIAADGLAKGLYLVKFADNTVVKVVK